MDSPTYEVEIIRSARDGDWRWRLVAENGRIVGGSAEGYVNETHAHRMAEQIFGDAPNVKVPPAEQPF